METKKVVISLDGELELSDIGMKNLVKGEELYVYFIQRENKAIYSKDLKKDKLQGFPQLTNHYLGEEVELREGSVINHKLFGKGNKFHVLNSQLTGSVRDREHTDILKLVGEESNFKGSIKVIDIPKETNYIIKYDNIKGREHIEEEPRKWY